MSDVTGQVGFVISQKSVTGMDVLLNRPKVNRQKLDDMLTRRGLSHTFSLATVSSVALRLAIHRAVRRR